MSRWTFVVAGFALIACSKPAEPWVDYVSEGGGFRVRMPPNPVTSRDPQYVLPQHRLEDGGSRPEAPWVAEQTVAERAPVAAYSVRWYDVDTRVDTGRYPTEFFDGMLAAGADPVVERHPIQFGPNPGVEYVRESTSAKRRTHSRIVLVENRVFHFWVDSPLAKPEPASATVFFDSFRLAARPEWRVVSAGDR